MAFMGNGKRGSAPLALLNVATGATAVAVAAAGFVLQSETVAVPVSIGGLLQLLALGGIAIIWWLVRGAFTELRDNVKSLKDSCNDMAERLSYMEGRLKQRLDVKAPPRKDG